MRPAARIAVVIASVAVVVVLFVLLRPDAGGEPVAGGSPSTATSTPPTETGAPSRSETPTASPTPDVVEIEVEVEDGRIQGRDEYTVSAGERVRLEVTADVTDHIHVHGYDLLADVSPDRPAVIAFRADAPGVYEVELEEAGELLFHLRVEP